MTDKKNTYAGWTEALQIFARYSADDVMEIGISVTDSVIYVGPHPDAVTAQDVEKLEALGWRINEEYECFERFT